MRNRGIDWDREPLLGKVTDVTLAEMRGVNSTTVMRARRRRGIPAYEPRPGPETTAAAPSSGASMVEFDVAVESEPEPTTMRNGPSQEVVVASMRGLDPSGAKAAQPFDEWLGEQDRGPMRPWHRWPEGAKAEVMAVLRRNDEQPGGHKPVPARAMVQRLADAWAVDASTQLVEVYCRTELGRAGGWRHA